MDQPYLQYGVYFMAAMLGVLITIKLVSWLLSVLRVSANCWFCNENSWIKFLERNCWTCPRCEQYNGFDADGGYNKPIIGQYCHENMGEQCLRRSPTTNGLCRICNINQQLKIVQLANFVPVNEKKFDAEIESYKGQLEKCYKLCTPCQKFLNFKLTRDKEKMLSATLMFSKSFYASEKRAESNIRPRVFRVVLLIAASLLLIVTAYEFFSIVDFKYLVSYSRKRFRTVNNFFSDLAKRHSDAFSQVSHIFESLAYRFDELLMNVTMPRIRIENSDVLMAEHLIGGFGSILQLILNLSALEPLSNGIIYNLLWTICWVSSFIHTSGDVFAVVKMSIALALVISYTKSTFVSSATRKTNGVQIAKEAKKTKQSSVPCDESGDDVSLRNFGIDTTDGSLNSSKTSYGSPKYARKNGMQIPRSDLNRIPNKPSFMEYQSQDSDCSDIDEGFGGLSLGTKRKVKSRSDVFSLRKYDSTNSHLFQPIITPLGRQLISPSRLMHGTQQSWVAGGYWGGGGGRLRGRGQSARQHFHSRRHQPLFQPEFGVRVPVLRAAH